MNASNRSAPRSQAAAPRPKLAATVARPMKVIVVTFCIRSTYGFLRGTALHLALDIGRMDRVAGILDFGDMVFGWTVGDLAIAATYAACTICTRCTVSTASATYTA